MIQVKGHPNRLGVYGWLGGGRWGIERYMFTIHRITGLGLLLYFVLHICLTALRLMGQASWGQAMAAVDNIAFLTGEYLVFAAFAIHGLNGLRLILIELGLAIGKPIEPVYPYRTSVHIQRPLAVATMVLAVAAATVGGLDMFLWK